LRSPECARISEVELHELDPVEISLAGACGQVAKIMPVAGPGHAEIGLAEQGDVGPRLPHETAHRRPVLESLRIERSHPERPGPRERPNGRHAFDGPEGGNALQEGSMLLLAPHRGPAGVGQERGLWSFESLDDPIDHRAHGTDLSQEVCRP
jgi:hypothetical protein